MRAGKLNFQDALMTWCVNSILTTFTLQRFSHTMSSSILHSFPFAPSHLGLFIKSRDVIDENYVKFNSCDLWDNFDMKEEVFWTN